MARDLTSSFKTEITSASLSPIMLAEFQFDGSTIRFWSGVGDLTWNGDTYTGSGDLLKASKVAETQQLKANNIVFMLTGIKASLVNLAMTNDYQGRPASLWFAMLDSSKAVVSDPFQAFKGKMDVMEPTDDGERATISLSVENELADLQRPNDSWYTDNVQQQLFSGDVGLEYVAALQEREIILGGGQR